MVCLHNGYNVFFPSFWCRSLSPLPYFLQYGRIAVHTIFYGVFKIRSCERACKTKQLPSSSALNVSSYNKHLLFPLKFSDIPSIFKIIGISTTNPLKPELNSICYLLALLAHHFLHVSRIRVKSLTFRRLMSYMYMEHPFLMFLDHTQRRSTVGRTPLDE